MSDGAGGDQLLTLGTGRAQEVHLEIKGGKSGASGCNRLDRRPAGAFGQQGDDTSEDCTQLLQQARTHGQREHDPPVLGLDQPKARIPVDRSCWYLPFELRCKDLKSAQPLEQRGADRGDLRHGFSQHGARSW